MGVTWAVHAYRPRSVSDSDYGTSNMFQCPGVCGGCVIVDSFPSMGCHEAIFILVYIFFLATHGIVMV